ncbi:hypothetical protein NN561_009527 [Cricetulus griseus]
MRGAAGDRSPVIPLCPQTALADGAAAARANQERVPPSRRPGDLEAGVSPRTPLSLVAVAARAPVAPLPSSCNTSSARRVQSPADACGSRPSLPRCNTKTAPR